MYSSNKIYESFMKMKKMVMNQDKNASKVSLFSRQLIICSSTF